MDISLESAFLLASKWAEESTLIKGSFQCDNSCFVCEGKIRGFDSESIWIATFDSTRKQVSGFFQLNLSRAVKFDYRDSREAPPEVTYVEELLKVEFADGMAVIYVPR